MKLGGSTATFFAKQNTAHLFDTVLTPDDIIARDIHLGLFAVPLACKRLSGKDILGQWPTPVVPFSNATGTHLIASHSLKLPFDHFL